MRAKKGRASPPKILRGANGVLLEEMRAHSRATIEAVEANRATLEGKIDALARETGGRLTVLEAAVRQNSRDIKKNGADIRKNSADIRKNSADIRVLTERVDTLGPLDQRVSAIERRLAGEA